jgi:hypothetical protein
MPTRSLLYRAARSRHEDESVFLELLDGQQRRDSLPLVERQQIHDRLAAGAASRLWQLIDLEPVELTCRGEAEQRVVRVGDEQLLDEVLVLDRGRRLAATAATLRLVFADGLSLGIAPVRKGYDHVLRRDEILDREVDSSCSIRVRRSSP